MPRLSRSVHDDDDEVDDNDDDVAADETGMSVWLTITRTLDSVRPVIAAVDRLLTLSTRITRRCPISDWLSRSAHCLNVVTSCS